MLIPVVLTDLRISLWADESGQDGWQPSTQTSISSCMGYTVLIVMSAFYINARSLCQRWAVSISCLLPYGWCLWGQCVREQTTQLSCTCFWPPAWAVCVYVWVSFPAEWTNQEATVEKRRGGATIQLHIQNKSQTSYVYIWMVAIRLRHLWKEWCVLNKQCVCAHDWLCNMYLWLVIGNVLLG